MHPGFWVVSVQIPKCVDIVEFATFGSEEGIGKSTCTTAKGRVDPTPQTKKGGQGCYVVDDGTILHENIPVYIILHNG